MSDLQIKRDQNVATEWQGRRRRPSSWGDGPKMAAFPSPNSNVLFTGQKETNKSLWWVNIGMISVTADSYLQTAAIKENPVDRNVWKLQTKVRCNVALWVWSNDNIFKFYFEFKFYFGMFENCRSPPGGTCGQKMPIVVIFTTLGGFQPV